MLIVGGIVAALVNAKLGDVISPKIKEAIEEIFKKK